MFGRNRNDRYSQNFQNRERSQRSHFDDREENSGSELGGGPSRFTSADRTYSMTDRNYEPISRESYIGSRGYQGYEDYPGPRQGRNDFGTDAPFRWETSLNGGMGRMNGPASSSGAFSDRGHYGKGPKGYRRSDERIQDEVCDVLTAHYDIDASEIEVDVKDGVVMLGGSVDSRRTKRLAEDIVADLNGVTDVRNNLRIFSQDSRKLESGTDGKTYRPAHSSTDSTLGARSSRDDERSSGSTTRQ